MTDIRLISAEPFRSEPLLSTEDDMVRVTIDMPRKHWRGNKDQILGIVDPDTADALPEDFRRIALLFTSRCTRTKMTSGEKTAWSKTKSFISNADLQLLEWFYALDKSADYDQTWHRKGQPAALLNNLNAQLDLAHEMKESMRKSQPKLGTAPQW